MSLPELNININAGSLKALRAARVLRPLKLVSGIPSKLMFSSAIATFNILLMKANARLLHLSMGKLLSTMSYLDSRNTQPDQNVSDKLDY